jgi:hypothetical protein
VSSQRSILLLCDQHRSHAGNVLEHIAALVKLSRHRVYPFNPIDRPAGSSALDLSEFDAVVIHYTIMVTLDRYLPPGLADKLAGFEGLKIQFIQDEYRRVDAFTARMRQLGIDVLYTCIPPPTREQVYGPRLPGVTLVTTLPGLVPDEFVGRSAPPAGDRQIDVGYRGREVPYWLGRLGQEKVEIGSRFLELAGEYGLRCDISSIEGDRIYGEAWNRFLASCKATLGTESGASILDTDGSVEARVRQYVVRHPGAAFEEVERAVLAPYEGNVTIAVASPRLFEAAALRTAMVLFRGEYSDVVEAGVHYIPLEKDFSNIADVVERLQDPAVLNDLTATAYADLIASGRYSLGAFVAEFDDLVSARSEARSSGLTRSYRRAQLGKRLDSFRNPWKLRFLVGTVLKPTVTLAIVLRDGPVRRLALADRNARLFEDLWRLAVLRRTARERGQFHVHALLEADSRRLFLESSPGPASTDGRVSLAPEVSAALSSASLQEIVWSHAGVGQTVPLLDNGFLPVHVGDRGLPGAYGFDELVNLSRRAPERVLEALEPLLCRPEG